MKDLTELLVMLLGIILRENDEIGPEGDSGLRCLWAEADLAYPVIEVPCRQAHRCWNEEARHGTRSYPFLRPHLQKHVRRTDAAGGSEVSKLVHRIRTVFLAVVATEKPVEGRQVCLLEALNPRLECRQLSEAIVGR
jgi:hypothetical protein